MAFGRRIDAPLRVFFFFLLMVAGAVCAEVKKQKVYGGDGETPAVLRAPKAAAPAALGAPKAAAPAAAASSGRFDISKLGAIADGKTDTTKVLEDAFNSACGATGKQEIVIPKGNYLTGPLNFTGPCKADSMTIKLEGNLLSNNNLSMYKANWIEIMRVSNLEIVGKGALNGQGQGVWMKNTCTKSYDCKVLPNSLVFDFCNNTKVEGITLLNAKFFHLNMYECHGITINNLNISAPGDSPNTDGIHMGDSSNITISDTAIGTGDDCISIGPGSSRVKITGVSCGPGHGISVGSLGRYKDEKDVTDITVKNCVLKKSTNGVRIKSYEDAKSPITLSKLTYENIKMDDVKFPIIVDQKYCPNNICTSKGDSERVTIKDLVFKNITGTSATPEAISLLCSDKRPCSDIKMTDIKIKFTGTNNKTMAVCTNAKVTDTMGVDNNLKCPS